MDTFNQEHEKELNEWLGSKDSDLFFSAKKAPEQMDMKFYALLEKHRKPAKKSRSWLWLFRLAIPMLAILVAFFIGKEFSSDSLSLNEEDFATELLNADDAGDKINLVSTTKIDNESDDKVIDAVLFTLSHDESVNVRLACINTLYDYAYLPKVRSGLIQAVSNQTSPLVLANLAEAINASGKKLSKEEFMELINEDLPPPIKTSIDASLIKI